MNTHNLSKHLDAWLTAWRARDASEPGRRQRQEMEFMPAALEIQDSPPGPLGRAVVWVLMLFFVIALVWAIFGKIDIVAVAPGKIIPSGHSKTIQPLEIGVVRRIHVREGQAVQVGDVLIEMDPTASGADQQRLAKEWMAARLNLARLRALAKNHSAMHIPAGADPRLAGEQQQLLENQRREHQARLDAVGHSITQRRADAAGVAEQIRGLEATVPLIQKRAAGIKTLADSQYTPMHDYLTLQQQSIEQTQTLAAQRKNLESIQASIAESQSQQQTLIAEFRRQVLTDLAQVEQQHASLYQELVKAEQRKALQRLTAPVAGVVQELAVHTVGGVVTPAQALMVIVPKSRQLEVEARMLNKDIGFVREGQSAEVKIEAFPFTKYGSIDATLRTISKDAIEDEKLGLVYASRVLMARDTILVEDKQVRLSPGMAVTVEVKTGKRRIIEYFLSPLLRYQDESVRER